MREALEAPACACPRRRLHTRECNKKHVTPDKKVKRLPCPDPRNGAIGACACNRKCDCRYDLLEPPCPHTQEATHAMSLERWQKFLESNDPDGEYAEPEAPTEPEACSSRDHRVAILEARAARGVGLWHTAGDRFSDDALAQLMATTSGGTGREIVGARKG